MKLRDKRLWFETDAAQRAEIAEAYNGHPLTHLALPLRMRLALARHYGRYESVADVIRADSEIRHVKNLGTKSLEALDARIRALMSHVMAGAGVGAADRLTVLRAVQSVPGRVIPIAALTTDGYPETPWFVADRAAREDVARRVADMPVAAWGLGNRTRNALAVSKRYATVADVLRAESDIRACRGLGRVTLAELHRRSVATLQGTDETVARWLGFHAGLRHATAPR